MITGHGGKRPGDVDLWPFDLGTGVQCHSWHGQPSCQFRCFCNFYLSSYGQIRVKLRTWQRSVDFWPLTSPRMSVMRVIVLHPCTRFEVCRPSRSDGVADFRSRR